MTFPAARKGAASRRARTATAIPRRAAARHPIHPLRDLRPVEEAAGHHEGSDAEQEPGPDVELEDRVHPEVLVAHVVLEVDELAEDRNGEAERNEQVLGATPAVAGSQADHEACQRYDRDRGRHVPAQQERNGRCGKIRSPPQLRDAGQVRDREEEAVHEQELYRV